MSVKQNKIIWKDCMEYEICESDENDIDNYEYIEIDSNEFSKSIGYTAIKKFTDLGMDQVNIHLMVSQETLDFVYEVLNDRLSDSRLKDMHAIVFLGVKPKGRAKNGYHSLTKEQYAELIKYCLDKSIAIGFDSCSSGKFENAVKGMDLTDDVKKQFIEASESCESSIFSSYINVHGEYWHCSFTENEPNQICVDVLNVNDFISEVWYSDTVIEFRNKLISGMVDGCRHCHVFPQINE